jgi:hypothetical protein
MAQFASWCVTKTAKVASNTIRTLSADPTKLASGVSAVAADLRTHYASPERLAELLERFGKTRAATFVREKLPGSKRARSGDLGEVLCTNYVSEFTPFTVGIRKLRWKDHRQMAMRGDDILAARVDGDGATLHFLKGEVKSRVKLAAADVQQAPSALKANENRPSPHSLSFVADRLHETGQAALGKLIDAAQLNGRIPLSSMTHLVFTFSGNDSTKMLTSDLEAYAGRVEQMSVGVIVPTHQEFINEVFTQAVPDEPAS